MLIQANSDIFYGDMASKSEEKRKRVVQFLNRVMTTRADLRKCTAHHFMTEGVPKSTVDNIIKQYLAQGTFERRRGSGRPAKSMTSMNKQRLKRIINHKTGVSQQALTSKFSCDQSYICRLIKKLKIAYRRRTKVPRYKDDDAKREAMKRCRILYQKFRTLDFVIDDEKYSGLSGFQMSKCPQMEATTRQTSAVLRWQ